MPPLTGSAPGWIGSAATRRPDAILRERSGAVWELVADRSHHLFLIRTVNAITAGRWRDGPDRDADPADGRPDPASAPNYHTGAANRDASDTDGRPRDTDRPAGAADGGADRHAGDADRADPATTPVSRRTISSTGLPEAPPATGRWGLWL